MSKSNPGRIDVTKLRIVDEKRELEQAARQALEALREIEWSNNSQWQSDRAKTAIAALREALEEEEPYTPDDMAYRPGGLSQHVTDDHQIFKLGYAKGADDAERRAKARGEQPAEASKEPLNLSCKSVQARLAAQWGYVKADAAEQEPVALGPLAKRRVFDYIRGAYDLGYNDARNARAVPGDNAPGYKGRDVEVDHGGALFNALHACITAPQPARQPLTDEQVWKSEEIMAVNAAVGLVMNDLMMLVRAVERIHGTGGEA